MARDPEQQPLTRDDYPVWSPVTTRWSDNDIYGHLNNTVYYSMMDTVINHWLITEGGLDIHAGTVIGLCVQSQCEFKAPAAYPEPIEVGLRLGRLGNSSVTYQTGVFRTEPEVLLAEGTFTHVFVDRGSRRPVPIPAQLRAALTRLNG